jgi:hypothetical protein
MASHSARADQLPAKAHSTPRPTVAPKLLLLLVAVKEAGELLTVSPGLPVPTQAPPPLPKIQARQPFLGKKLYQ